MVHLYEPLTYIRLSAKYGFEKPNDRGALELMNAAALGVMNELTDINIAYGMSDEFRCGLCALARSLLEF